MIVIVYREMAWISIGAPFTPQAAALDSMRVDDLIEAFTQAVAHARGDKNP